LAKRHHQHRLRRTEWARLLELALDFSFQTKLLDKRYLEKLRRAESGREVGERALSLLGI
jgi:hypothetical protein